MDWLTSLGTTDVAIICATLLGPVLAVQAQKFLERRREVKERRLAIFRTLMATRAAILSPAHVEALNAVPMEFYGSGAKLRQINESWKLYLDHYDDRLNYNEAWAQKRVDLFIDLLHLISQFLGYGFSKTQLLRDIYSPKAHGDLEAEQTIIRKRLVALLQGEITLPLAIKEFPNTTSEADNLSVPPEAMAPERVIDS
ncbi:DUF6680 family protein [Rhizobium sp. SL42]|uniref:DUF6680 family protein n=1 Tax=Rhizobium sp. SL42 TaxID=2806346 RepID=UPI001F48EC46|nr:DUF6680 family protein [Rhizobium sp. SL42]UJW76387.1 hypothetical protein IM739_07880 [Rhizobium sp. SL42]